MAQSRGQGDMYSHRAHGDFQLTTNSKSWVEGKTGENATLPCQLSPETSAVSMTISWFKGTECIYLYKNGQVIEGRGYEGRLSLNTQQLHRGNVSLTLRGYNDETDRGYYVCQVKHGEQEVEAAVVLSHFHRDLVALLAPRTGEFYLRTQPAENKNKRKESVNQLALSALKLARSQGSQEPELCSAADIPTMQSDGRDAPYVMTEDPGFCLIIDNEKFVESPRRLGSENDSLELGRVFSLLGFKVIRLKNQTSDQMVQVLEFFALKGNNRSIDAEIWSNRDLDFKKNAVGQPKHGNCFVCCILSHGDEDGISGTDENPITVRKIRSPFSGKECPALFQKPKLFFIQACRGEDDQTGVVRADASSRKRGKSLPEYADFLLGFANIDPCSAYRDDDYGTWYIQELCNQLEKGYNGGDDILTILTRVNAAVGQKDGRVEVAWRTYEDVKQSPGFESYLTKKLIFFRRV